MGIFKKKNKSQTGTDMVERKSYPQPVSNSEKNGFLDAEVVNTRTKPAPNKAKQIKEEEHFDSYKKIEEKDHTVSRIVWAVLLMLLIMGGLGVFLYFHLTGQI